MFTIPRRAACTVAFILVHLLVLTASNGQGHVFSWGSGFWGQLGNGEFGFSNVAVPAIGLTGITTVASGTDHNLALRSDGTVWASGDNDFGQLGNGTNIRSDVSIQVPNLSNVIAVAAGGEHSLALNYDGTVWAWGGEFLRSTR